MKKGRPKLDYGLRLSIIESRFNRIKELMEHGYTKSLACEHINVSRSWIYKNFTDKQMVILDQIYFSFKTGSKSRKVIGNGLLNLQ